jgi:hypothetical protein
MDYLPQYLSEFENVYPIIHSFLNDDEHILNIYGDIGCGKTTLVNFYLKDVNYHYLEDYTYNLVKFQEYLKKLCPTNVLSYFITRDIKRDIIVIDNYDMFDINYKNLFKTLNDFKLIVISNKPYFKYKVEVKPPSDIYLYHLLSAINTVNNTNHSTVNIDGCFHKFLSSMKYGSTVEYDRFESEIDTLKSIYNGNLNLDIHDISNVHSSYPRYIKSIDKLCSIADSVSYSIDFSGLNYYQELNQLIIRQLDAPIECITYLKLNYQKKNAVLKYCNRYNCSPLDLSLIKIIKSNTINNGQ